MIIVKMLKFMSFLYHIPLKIKATLLCCLLSTVLFAQKIDTLS